MARLLLVERAHRQRRRLYTLLKRHALVARTDQVSGMLREQGNLIVRSTRFVPSARGVDSGARRSHSPLVAEPDMSAPHIAASLFAPDAPNEGWSSGMFAPALDAALPLPPAIDGRDAAPDWQVQGAHSSAIPAVPQPSRPTAPATSHQSESSALLSRPSVPLPPRAPMSRRIEEFSATPRQSEPPPSERQQTSPDRQTSPSVTKATPLGPDTPGELFAGRGTNRSPQSWLARLTGTSEPTEPPVVDSRQHLPNVSASAAPPAPDRESDDVSAQALPNVPRQPLASTHARPLGPPVQQETLSTQASAAAPMSDTPGELFAGRGTNRSPQSWLARLTGTTEVSEPIPPDRVAASSEALMPGAERTSPEQMNMSLVNASGVSSASQEVRSAQTTPIDGITPKVSSESSEALMPGAERTSPEQMNMSLVNASGVSSASQETRSAQTTPSDVSTPDVSPERAAPVQRSESMMPTNVPIVQAATSSFRASPSDALELTTSLSPVAHPASALPALPPDPVRDNLQSSLLVAPSLNTPPLAPSDVSMMPPQRIESPMSSAVDVPAAVSDSRVSDAPEPSQPSQGSSVAQPKVSPVVSSDAIAADSGPLPAASLSDVVETRTPLVSPEGHLSNVQIEQPIFAPSVADRSPQAWAARLMAPAQTSSRALTPEAELTALSDEARPATSSQHDVLPTSADTSAPVDPSVPSHDARLASQRRLPASREYRTASTSALQSEPRRDVADQSTSKPSEGAVSEQPRASELFAAPETDRSPQAWAARLAASARPQPLRSAAQDSAVAAPSGIADQHARSSASAEPVQPASTSLKQPTQARRATERRATPASPNAPRTQASRAKPSADIVPTPLSEGARRFLRPLVGIDPSTVRIYRGAIADQVAAAHAADAVAVGENIALAAGHDDESPETLGLVAHELIHVARRRDPRFVPPLVSNQPNVAEDEETIARSVESRVTRAAWTQADQGIHTSDADSTGMWEGISAVDEPSSDSFGSSVPGGSWGGLPAPWEPLPVWLNASSTPAPPQAAASRLVAPAVLAAMSVGPSVPGATAPAAIQLAARDRSLDVQPETPVEQKQQASQEPEPDLDALARQVYAILKQRLAAERRRLG